MCGDAKWNKELSYLSGKKVANSGDYGAVRSARAVSDAGKENPFEWAGEQIKKMNDAKKVHAPQAPAKTAPGSEIVKTPKFQFGVNADANAKQLEGVPMLEE